MWKKPLKWLWGQIKAQDYWTVCTGCTCSFNKINTYIKHTTIRLQRVFDYKIGEKPVNFSALLLVYIFNLFAWKGEVCIVSDRIMAELF